MLPCQVAIFTDKPQLHYSELTRELLKWQLVGGHGTSRVCSWAAQWQRCRLYSVVNLQGPSGAKGVEEKGHSHQWKSIYKEVFHPQTWLLLAQVQDSGLCQVSGLTSYSPVYHKLGLTQWPVSLTITEDAESNRKQLVKLICFSLERCTLLLGQAVILSIIHHGFIKTALVVK